MFGCFSKSCGIAGTELQCVFVASSSVGFTCYSNIWMLTVEGFKQQEARNKHKTKHLHPCNMNVVQLPCDQEEKDDDVLQTWCKKMPVMAGRWPFWGFRCWSHASVFAAIVLWSSLTSCNTINMSHKFVIAAGHLHIYDREQKKIIWWYVKMWWRQRCSP